jgi:hypothetical protein
MAVAASRAVRAFERNDVRDFGQAAYEVLAMPGAESLAEVLPFKKPSETKVKSDA